MNGLTDNSLLCRCRVEHARLRCDWWASWVVCADGSRSGNVTVRQKVNNRRAVGGNAGVKSLKAGTIDVEEVSTMVEVR